MFYFFLVSRSSVAVIAVVCKLLFCICRSIVIVFNLTRTTSSCHIFCCFVLLSPPPHGCDRLSRCATRRGRGGANLILFGHQTRARAHSGTPFLCRVARFLTLSLLVSQSQLSLASVFVIFISSSIKHQKQEKHYHLYQYICLSYLYYFAPHFNELLTHHMRSKCVLLIHVQVL